MTVAENPRAVAYTGQDGVERRYLPYTVNKLRECADLLVGIDPGRLMDAFVMEAAERHQGADKGDLPGGTNVLLDFLAPLLTERYCSEPMSREEMAGDHFDLDDLGALLKIALCIR